MPQSNGSVVIENMMKAMPIAARRNATSRPASSPTRDRGTTPSTLNSKNGGPSARTCTSVIASRDENPTASGIIGLFSLVTYSVGGGGW